MHAIFESSLALTYLEDLQRTRVLTVHTMAQPLGDSMDADEPRECMASRVGPEL